MTIRVMLADDHPVVRAGHRFLLEQSDDICIVAEAEDSDRTYHSYFDHRPDVLVLDLSMPGAGGLTVLRRIVNHDPEANILVYTMHEETLYARRALEAGAKGYISKSTEPEILPEAIRTIARREHYIAATIAQQLAWQYANGEEQEGTLTCLTNREFEIFCLAAKGLSVREISDHLYISHKTAANHMTQIKRKLEVSTMGELVRLAYMQDLASK
ncbi:two-component system, NarL family, invasion response regulator UvrY [Methylomarinovum caldicuralii]|uniref:Two-component system, NarL family, invasion response regulator UvrY n=1 Tax=Methylomarinovum caldicuralii TaxID=438856 RepID=A0AAU9C440_9GAMM|nr:response regulator transcription factor [Methylomarinovum caldicuralii]BCX82498.1 two-component system, NarL family, invasion response regulator UvrY [Methylomarinovum caldicuralii]